MPLIVNRGFPPRLSQEEKVTISRHLGVWVWVGVFLSICTVLWWWPLLAGVPGLCMQVLVIVGGFCLIEIVLGYLLFAGIFVKS